MCSGTGTPSRSASRIERARDQLDLGRAARLDVLEHGRVVRAAPLRREHVHLPRVLVQLDPGGGGDRLALVDEGVDEMAEVGWLAPRPRSAASCGSPVSAATAFTVALKISFDHWAGRRSGKARAFRPERSISAASSSTRVVRDPVVRAEPGLRVEDVLDVRVVVPRAAHEGDAGDERPVPVPAHDLLGAEAVLDRHDGGFGKAAGERTCGVVEPGRFRRHDRDVELRQLGRVVGGVDTAGELGPARYLAAPRPRVRARARARRVSTQTSATRLR